MTNAYIDAFKVGLVARLNEVNNTAFHPEDFEMGLPYPYIPRAPDPLVKVNTKVKLTAKEGSGFYGSKLIEYWRKDLAEVLSGVAIPLSQVAFPIDVINYIKLHYGVDLIEEVDNFTIPQSNTLTSGCVKSLLLRARLSSYSYTGEVVVTLGKEYLAALNTGTETYYYTFLKTSDPAKCLDSVKCVDAEGLVNPYFNYLGNARNILTYDSRVVLRRSSGEFVIQGSFDLEQFDGLLYTRHQGNALVVDGYGMLLAVETTPTFSPTATTYESSYLSPYHYCTEGSDNHLVSYTDIGNLYRNYPSLTPSVVRFGKQGELYVVSDESYGQSLVKIRPNGDVDDTFTKATFKLSNGSAAAKILDMVVSDEGGIYVYYLNPFGYDHTAPRLLVNDIPVSTSPAVGCINPCIKLDSCGCIDPLYKTHHDGISSIAMVDQTLPIYDTEPKKLLSYRQDRVFFLAPKLNPATGYNHFLPCVFDKLGKIQYLNMQDFVDQVKWVEIAGAVNEDVFVVFGSYQAVTLTGLSLPVLGVCSYTAEGRLRKVLWSNVDNGFTEILGVFSTRT